MTDKHFVIITFVYFVDSYFIQKGADVNAIGGELQGTPLHWATRYSKYYSLEYLLRTYFNKNCYQCILLFPCYKINNYVCKMNP